MNGSDAQQEVLFHLWHLPAADDWVGLIYLFIDYACMMDERRPWVGFVYACIAGLLVASSSSCQERVLDINRPFSNTSVQGTHLLLTLNKIPIYLLLIE